MIPLPRTRSGQFVLGVVLIDLPALAVALAFGFAHGFARSYNDVTEWRLQHPWSMVPSVALAALLVWRIVRRRQGDRVECRAR